MKKLLIISPHFPPINAPDMQRVRMSLPHYRTHGWEPIVLCVDDRWVDGVREPELVATYPADIRVERCGAFSARWTRYLGIGNLGLRSFGQMLFAGFSIIRQEKIDLVYFSTTQFAILPLGRIWRTCFGVPYVIDLQDPWRTDYYERAGSRRPPGGWKYQFARLLAWMLEEWSFRRVGALMSVSQGYVKELRARYPFLADVPAAVIRFGASREDLKAAQAMASPTYQFSRGSGEIHILYTGASGPVMPHSLTVLFDGLRRYREKHPERASRVRLHFLGTSYVAPGRGSNSVIPVAQACGVADMVSEIPHRLGHLECLRLQCEADILLLPGSSDLAYSPSKLYPYFLTGRPMLGVVFRGSVMEGLLDDLACAFMVRFREADPKDEAHAQLARFFDAATAGLITEILPRRNEALFRVSYLVESLTLEQVSIFSAALSRANS